MDENKEPTSTRILASPEEIPADKLTHPVKRAGLNWRPAVFFDRLTGLVKFVSPHSKALVIVAWMIIVSIQVIFTIPALSQLSKGIGLDNSWFIGLPAAMQNNDWSGRDFYFTYGPLWQFVAQLGAGLNSSGSAIDGYPGIVLAVTLLEIGLFGLSIGLIKQLDARRSLIVLAAIALLNFQSLSLYARPMAAVVCALLVQRCLAAPTTRSRLSWAVAAGAAFMAAQLISADIGVYTVITAVAVMLIFSLLGRFRQRLKQPALLAPLKYLTTLAVMLGTYLTANLLLSLLFTLTSPDYRNFFDYQYYNIEIIRGYSYAMGGTTWDLAGVSTFVFALSVIYVICFSAVNLSRIPLADSYLLTCLAVCGIFQLKGATVRSDLGHAMLGATPLILLFLIIGVAGGARGWYKNTFFKVSWWLLAVFLLAAWPFATTQPLRQLNALIDGKASLSEQLQNLTTGHIPLSDLLPPGLAEATASTNAILSFPQDNYVPIALHKKIVAPVHQAYSAFTLSLQQKYVDDLQRHKNTFEVVYGLDGLTGVMLENVQQVTRVPIIFEYLYRNYKLKSPQVFGNKFVVLEPRATPAEFRSQAVAFDTKPWNGQLITFKMPQPATCSMLRLTQKINYPVLTLLGRATQLNVKIWSKNKIIQESSMVAIEPGKSFSTYISLMDLDKFYNIFSDSNPVQTRQLDSLQMVPLSTAFLGFAPSAVEVSKIECITFSKGS